MMRTMKMHARVLVLAAMAAVVGVAQPAIAQPSPDVNAIAALFVAHDQAFNAKDLAALGAFYHPDVTVYEGGGINPGWADYRDRHLGPELKAFANLKFSHQKVVVRQIGPDAAYVTAEYTLDAVMDGKDVRSGGLATYVMIRESGRWMIRHSHTSSRRRS